jgi:hypothetical protein
MRELLAHDAALRAALEESEHALDVCVHMTVKAVLDRGRAAIARADAAEVRVETLEKALEKIENLRRLPLVDMADTDAQQNHDWSNVAALAWNIAAAALAGGKPCIMCGVRHCLICGRSRVGTAHPEHCTCP